MEKEDVTIVVNDDTNMDRWNILVNELIQDFDAKDLMFNEVKNLSKYQLGKLNSNIKDGRQYFDVLKNNLSPDDLLDFLINLMDCSGFSQDLYFGGQNIADTLKNHRENLHNYKRDLMRKDIYDENFVGREDEIRTLLEILKDKTSQYRGI